VIFFGFWKDPFTCQDASEAMTAITVFDMKDASPIFSGQKSRKNLTRF
jgi:hypothetical protein